jgi:hypothetical protein
MTDRRARACALCGIVCGMPCVMPCGIKSLIFNAVRHVRRTRAQAPAGAHMRTRAPAGACPQHPHMPHTTHIRAAAPFHAARNASRHAAHRARAFLPPLRCPKKRVVVEVQS